MIQVDSKDEVEVRKEYYDSGDLWFEAPCVNGEKHGISRGYYKSGTLLWETPYVNGKKHGISWGYYESGALMWETPYVNGKVHGIEKHCDREKSNIDRLTLYNKDRMLLSLRRESYKGY